MRDNKTEKHVRIVSTGHAEADMLGQVLLWIDKRQNSKLSQRPHRDRQTQSIFRVVVKWFQTAPTACLRSLKAWQDKKDADVPKYLSGLRKQNRNGK